MAEATTPKRRRPRGEGSIYRCADDRWRGALIVTDPDTGARVRRLVSGRTQAEVRDRLRDLRRQLEQGIGVQPGQPKTLAAYVAAWLPALQQRVRPATWRAHEQYLRLYVLPALGALSLSQLTPTAVERMTATMKPARRARSSAIERQLSPTTARGARTTLRLVLRDAERDGLVSRNVAALARPPRMERHELAVLTADETRRLLAGTEADALGPLYAVAATTGLRQGELLGLTWPDVDGLDGGSPSLTVRRSLARAAGGGWELAEPKTARSRRTLELGTTAARALRRQRTRQKEARLAAADLWQDRAGHVFTDPIGRPLNGSVVTHSFQMALALLGLPRVRFHDLRHGAASLMLAQGVPLKLVSDQLGHSSIAITADTYSHLDREQRRESSDAIERALASGDRP
jgi:integrase